jgi:Protein of unknown function (DUF732)
MLALMGALTIVMAAPAQADPDTDFSNQLHTYGIYGPKDYNAWIGKIMCKRLRMGTDANAAASATFLHLNLPKGTNEQATYQFLAAGIATYCPDQQQVLVAAAGQ